MGAKSILMGGLLIVCFLAVSMALKCYHCGQYNDGVGSITPCINDTYMKLMDCPNRENNYCIKYTSEGTMVRDCVKSCTEKEDWGSKTFCCDEDACNFASKPRTHISIFVTISTVVLFINLMAH